MERSELADLNFQLPSFRDTIFPLFAISTASAAVAASSRYILSRSCMWMCMYKYNQDSVSRCRTYILFNILKSKITSISWNKLLFVVHQKRKYYLIWRKENNLWYHSLIKTNFIKYHSPSSSSAPHPHTAFLYVLHCDIPSPNPLPFYELRILHLKPFQMANTFAWGELFFKSQKNIIKDEGMSIDGKEFLFPL